VTRCYSLISSGKIGLKHWPSGEPPICEGNKTVIVRNMPSFAVAFWGIAKGFIPKKITDKVRFFKAGDASYLEELESRIGLEHVPECFGGKCARPWPYNEGGSVTRHALASGEVEARLGQTS